MNRREFWAMARGRNKYAEAAKWPLVTFFECDKAIAQKTRVNIQFSSGQSTSDP